MSNPNQVANGCEKNDKSAGNEPRFELFNDDEEKNSSNKILDGRYIMDYTGGHSRLERYNFREPRKPSFSYILDRCSYHCPDPLWKQHCYKTVSAQLEAFMDEVIENQPDMEEVLKQLKVFEAKYISLLRANDESSETMGKDASDNENDEIDDDGAEADDEVPNIDETKGIGNDMNKIVSADDGSANDESKKNDASKAPRFVLFEEPDPAALIDVEDVMDIVGSTVHCTPTGRSLDIEYIMDVVGGAAQCTPRVYYGPLQLMKIEKNDETDDEAEDYDTDHSEKTEMKEMKAEEIF